MHGGLPASKLSNTQIVIDGAPITSLPTRKVTSTKIDVHDKIRIEKREVVEISSPVHVRRRSKNDSDSTNESSSDSRKALRRRSEKKHSERHRERRKKLVQTQKSFSDGYDSEMDGHGKDSSHEKIYRNSKKNRSKSEPSKRHKANAKHRRRRYRSDSESSSESDSYSEKKKSKKHRKRSKRKISSITESSSSESTERRSTKRRGKKTSIHIENDDEKQSVNIIKYKSGDRSDYSQNIERRVSLSPNVEQQQVSSLQIEEDKEYNQTEKSRAHSETETDTLSVKTNMVVTEAQIHMERQSSQQGNSEITVTLDSSNNVSIDAANMLVTQKDVNEGSKSDSEKSFAQATAEDSEVKAAAKEIVHEKEQPSEASASTSVATKTDGNMTPSNDSAKTVSKADDSKTPPIDGKEEEVLSRLVSSEKQDETKEATESSKGTELSPSPVKTPDNSKSPSPTLELARKRSFQVLSGPEQALSHVSGDNKTSLDATSLEKSESQEKISSPVVSFAAKDEIFESKDSDKISDHLMGEKVTHEEGGPEPEVQTGVNLLKNNSENNNRSEDKRKEYTASITGSSTENTHSIEKEVSPLIGENVSSEDRAVQQVIMENVSGEFDVDLSLTPKRTRKTSTRDSQGSSRNSSIYETESYKVLSDIASGETTGILKKSSKVEEGSLDDKEMSVGGKLGRDGSIYGRVPSVSDNEIYSHTEVNGRRKRFRKKSRTKSRTTIRSKSENSERGYESSGLIDSGFEPSPRALQRRITSPRLSAYYQQRNASGRYSGKSDSRIPVRKPGDKYAVDMKSVTQRIQTNMRRLVIFLLYPTGETN